MKWYHFHLNHPVAVRLDNTLTDFCYWNGIKYQAKHFARQCKKFQQFKKSKGRYVNLPPMDISELTPCNTVQLDLIGPYTKTVRKLQPGNVIK